MFSLGDELSLFHKYDPVHLVQQMEVVGTYDDSLALECALENVVHDLLAHVCV